MGAGFLGILSLDTAFARIVGDAGNPDSYPFAARVAVVPGADSPLIVRDGAPEPELLARFVAAARGLEADGAAAIVSTCGFLVTAQAEVAAAVRVPVMLSALSLYPVLRASHAGRIGIVTASATALGPRALAAAGVAADEALVAGLEDAPAFASVFLAPRAQQPPALDEAAITRCVLRACAGLQDRAPDLGAILLECGNLPPYAGAVRAATGLPVYHMLDAARLLMPAPQGEA